MKLQDIVNRVKEIIDYPVEETAFQDESDDLAIPEEYQEMLIEQAAINLRKKG